MEPTTSNEQEPGRPWERVKPTPAKDRQMRETFRPKAPSPGDEILARHDDELEGESPGPPQASTSTEVTCF